jgi:predicted metal-dependent peptidase
VCAGNDYSTWRRPNRRFVSAGVYMPSGVSETLGEIVIAVDTSGSIGGPELSQFLGEINAICSSLSPEVVRLLYWDTEVARAERYEKEQLHTITQSTKPAGGGGTSPSCITRYLAESNIKAQVVVVLTDGYVGTDWGGVWPCPVVWCIVGNEQEVPATGKAIHVEWTR